MKENRYLQHLKSEEWRVRRQLVLRRARNLCEKCGKRRARQVHHLTYERLGDEKLEDLEAVCAPCHHSYHPDKWELKPRPIYAWEFECLLCPSTEADLYLSGSYKMFICFGCGEPRIDKRKRSKKKKKPPRPRTVRCLECTKGFYTHADLYQHMRREHPDAQMPKKTLNKVRKRGKRRKVKSAR